MSERSERLVQVIVFAAVLLVCAVVASGQSMPARAAADKSTTSDAAVFPMSKGASWVYSARVKWGATGTSVGGVKTLRWTVMVADSYQRDDIAAALLKGGPWDLAWYDPKVQPQEHLIARIGSTYYLLHDEAAETMADIKAGKTADLKDRLADDIWFQVPIEIADNYCSPEAEERAPMGCWSVEKITTTHSLKIAGVKTAPEQTEYLLTFMTNPDTEMVTLVPGVGIVSWYYQHHGTVAEASLKLVEFRPAGTRSPQRTARKPLASKH